MKRLPSIVAILVICTLVTLAKPCRADIVEMLVGYRHQDAILKFDAYSGVYLGVFSSSSWPHGFTGAPNGNLFVAAYTADAVWEHEIATGNILAKITIPPAGTTPPLSFGASPLSVDVGPDGMLYVASYHHGRIYRYSLNGSPAPNGAFPLSFGTDQYHDVKFGPDGLLYVSRVAGGVTRFDPKNGQQVGVAPFAATNGPMTFGPNGDLFVLDLNTNGVRRYAADTGADLGYFVSPGSGGLTTSSNLRFAPNGNLYISSDTLNGVLAYDGISGDYLMSIIAPSGYTGTSDIYFHVTSVPEPSSMILSGIVAGLAGWCAIRTRAKITCRIGHR